ncbi:ubiquinone biosynthesis accessory factor UbiK [Candidatus Palibaumannia cicadellinicola]|uniref:Ubiquinone biosynthesis accessory factor UbiK n=1 Tax=Candidatus Palibaumannia cicadellinicola TaxID=186490 RepID=A0A088MYZ9_9GAMM|nr:accessory factor UbiK family protein [Candidatus Baumannia cicadellinicola]AIN47542.1 hypothetical protein IM45_1361 [Candidatus Baumannia cicadellinicola]
MIDPQKIEALVLQVHDSLPKSIRNLGDDIEKKIRQVLQNQFNRMNLISCEKFDVQTQVLLRTREKLSQLELRLKALEMMLMKKDSDEKTTPDTPQECSLGKHSLKNMENNK